MMSRPDQHKGHWKQSIVHGMVEYWIKVCSLILVVAAFTQYRRFLLAAPGIIYTDYWVAVIEALLLAQVIMIGAVFRLGRGLEHKPLIYHTLYKTVIFSLWVGVFTLILIII